MHATTFLNEASFEALLGGRPFLPFDGGLLFYHEQLQKYILAQFDPEQSYTTEHFYQLPAEAPYQLINGKFVQTMGASIAHQRVQGRLYASLFQHVGKTGDVLMTPTDVVLGEKNVFQPDIFYVSVARLPQIQATRVVGAPEFVIEILSQSTEKNDRTTKMTQYGLYDVVEYWLVHPTEEFVEVYHNENKEMHLVQTAAKTDNIVSKAIDGFVLDLKTIF